jgi:phage-related protein
MGFGDSIGSVFVEIGANTDKLETGLGRAKSAVEGFGAKASGLAGIAAGGFGMAIAAPILSSVGGLFESVTSGVMDTNAAMESSATSWGVLLGGADQAQAKLDELFAFGANTPFEFQEVDKAAKLLQTFGGEALNNIDTMRLVGDAASGAGRNFEEVSFWTGRLYDAIQSGGPIGEATAELQSMGLMSGETRRQLEQMQKEGAKGPEVWNTFTASWERFGGMMEKQSATFNGRLSTMGDSINGLLAQAGKPIFEKISSGLGTFNDLLASPATTIFATNLANMVAGSLTEAFSLFERLGPVVTSTFGTLGTSLQSASSYVLPFVAGFGSVLATMGSIGAIMAVAIPIVGALGAALAFLVSPIGLVAAAVGLLATAWVNDWGGIQAIVGNLGNKLVSAFNAALPVLNAVGTAIGGGLAGAFNAITPLVTSLFVAFQSNLPAINGLWQQLVGIFGQVSATVQQLAPIFGGILVGAMGMMAGALGGLFGLLQGVLPGVIQMASGILTAFSGAWQVASSVVLGVINIISNALQGNWSGAWNAAKEMFSGVVDGIKTIFSGLGTFLTGALSALFNGLLGYIRGFVTGATGFFTGLANSIGGTVDTMATNTLNAARTWTNNLVDTIRNLATNAGTAALAVGRAIVDGISNAISAGAKAIADAAWNAAQSALDAAKAVLGINSPSKAFAEVGKWSVMGFAAGFEDNAFGAIGAVQSAMAATLNNAKVASNFEESKAKASSSTIVIQQHIAGSIWTEKELKEKAIEAMNDATRHGRF